VPGNGWDAFLATQRENCVRRHRKLGLDEKWLEQIPEFLAQDLQPKRTNALLHTEVSREHLLAENGGLSGLFDFADSMTGAPEYEFASFAPFLSQGDSDFLSRTLTAYGYREFDGVPQRFLAYLLLHRFSNLRHYLTLRPTNAHTLAELADEWWRLG
jgi:hygromycin-B 7''-O-kinase